MSTKIIAWILGFLSFFAFWNPNAQPNKIPETRTPPFEGELAPDKYGVWPTEDFSQGEICSLLPAFFDNLYFKKSVTDGILILHKGELVYERYADGWDANKAHEMFSVTKSVLSALVGIAIGEGKIKGVDQKVIEFYPDAVIASGQESKNDMTIEHLLTMTSGLPGDNDGRDWEWWAGSDTGKSAFESPQMAVPGERFAYSSGPSCQTLAGLVSRAVGRPLHEYAKDKLFGPLGMDSVEWAVADDGKLNFGGFGISMSPRDMARFGYLYLNYGRWEDQQIIPAKWVAVSPPKSKAMKAYGYLFWNFPLLPFGDSYEANGAYGQYIEIIPKWDMVIVRTGAVE